MAEIFFPLDFDTVPILTVGVPIYTIRASILNPDTNTDIQLPDHVWMLIRGSGTGARAVSRSDISDGGGTCFLGAGPEVLTDAEYSLFFSPFLKPAVPQQDAENIRRAYKLDREAWIDLDKPTAWAVPPNPAVIERRRLLRVPAWSTRRKAATGGFKVVPPKAAQFAAKGFVRFNELDPFGTKNAPWDMPLDFNWVRARIKFSFFDWRQNKEQVLPPGLLVDVRRDPSKALRQTNTQRVGAGTSGSMKDGTVYALLEGTKDIWKECHIQFRTPGSCFIDLRGATTPSPDTRLSNGPRPALPDDFNRLPGIWHSHGMRASFTTTPKASPASPSAPTPDKVWDQLHFDLAADQNGDNTTVSFHLDDVVLCSAKGTSLEIEAAAKPPTLFDHLLRIIKPVSAAPYQSDVKFAGRVIPALTAYPIGASPTSSSGKILEDSARLIHFEGGFHDLRDDRISTNAGKLGKVLCVGARAAKRDQHKAKTVLSPQANPGNPSEDLGLQMHLVDVPGIADPATGLPLQHLLLYVPMRIDIDPSRPLKPPTTEADMRALLNDAAELWSPGHPGTSSVMKGKSYALVPKDASKRSRIITRIRSFFSETSKDAQLSIVLTPDTSAAGDGRAFVRAGSITFDTILIFQVGPPKITPTHMTLFDTTVQRDKNARGGDGDGGDGVSSPFLTLAHEFGHAAHGLTDEYVEDLDTKAAFGFPRTLPLLPSFRQVDEGLSDWRPFYTDSASMLVSNHVVRLRHFWHHARNLNELFGEDLSEGPYTLIHETFAHAGGTGLEYTVPPDDDKSPWVPLFRDVPIPNGRGQLAMYALGDDEGSVERLFRGPTGGAGLPKSARMDGLVIVRSRLCFVLDPAMTPLEKLNVLKRDFHEKIYDGQYVPKIRLMLVPRVAGSTRAFTRVAILFQPHYSIDPVESKDADIVFDISKTATPARPNPFLSTVPTTKGAVVKVQASDFTFELAWRLVLGVPTALPGGKAPDLGVIRKTDLINVQRAFEQNRNEVPDSRDVDIYP